MMNPGTMVKPVEILLVEDNPVDVMITENAFNAGRVWNNLHVATNKDTTTSYLP
jgi:two-component system, chemotaxis family, response regulator Rcp1